MNYALYVLAGTVVLSTLFIIANTGKARKPSTPGDVVVITMINAAATVVLVLAAMQLH